MTIGENCEIHPTVVIGDGVTVGDRVSIGPYAVLTGPLDIGDDCWIGAHATLGAPPEWIGKTHPRTWTEVSPHRGVVIGAGTVIREMSAVQQGAERPTTIGRGGFVMNHTSVEHDVRIGEDCVLSPSSTLGGHVTLGDGVNLGMSAVVHQRRVIGRAQWSNGIGRRQDIPPFATCSASAPCAAQPGGDEPVRDRRPGHRGGGESVRLGAARRRRGTPAVARRRIRLVAGVGGETARFLILRPPIAIVGTERCTAAAHCR